MYQRVVAVVAVGLFSLLGLVAGIVTDVHDRDFPLAVSADSRLGLGFGDSQLTDREAFARLAELDADGGLGLVKLAPELGDGGDGRLLVAVGASSLPASFQDFSGARTTSVVGPERLANSSPDGSYLVTGDRDGLPRLEAQLRSDGVRVTRTDASVSDSLRFTLGEGGFRSAVLAAAALAAALALFWLAMRSRSRALRVLAGSPTPRIQAQDIGGLAAVLVAAAAAVSLAGAGYVALSRGTTYVRTFLEALLVLEAGVVVAALLTALAMSVLAWPTATSLATREPSIATMRSCAVVVQSLTFLLLLGAAGPTWSALQSSEQTAAEAAQWSKLAEQVTVEFGLSDAELTAVEPEVGRLVEQAESQGVLASSYTFTQQQWRGDLGDYSAVSFVDQTWLDLLTGDAPAAALEPVAYSDVQAMLTRELGPTLSLLSRDGAPAAQILPGLDYLRPVDGSRLPVSEGGSGSLRFLDDVLVAVVPSWHAFVDDRNLTSMVSTRNVVFTGVSTTTVLLDRAGLAPDALTDRGITGELRVVYVAEEGILRAQFLAYVVRLTTSALAALVAAFVVAAAIGAVISALGHARRDFPLRLSGQAWTTVLRRRVARQLVVGAALVAVVALAQRPEQPGALLLAATVGAVTVSLAHLLAARWTFAGVVARRS